MNELKQIKILFLILCVLTLLSVTLLGAHAYITATQKHEFIIPQREMTSQEIVLECEKLSAIATNENWSYAKCLENLNKSSDKMKILEAI